MRLNCRIFRRIVEKKKSFFPFSCEFHFTFPSHLKCTESHTLIAHKLCMQLCEQENPLLDPEFIRKTRKCTKSVRIDVRTNERTWIGIWEYLGYGESKNIDLSLYLSTFSSKNKCIGAEAELEKIFSQEEFYYWLKYELVDDRCEL